MANDFSADSNCISLYRFEGDPVSADSKGTNTLTLSAAPPAANGGTVKEGTFSALFTASASSFGYRTDTNLGSTFPLKSGTSNKTISVAQWIRLVSAPSDGTFMVIWAKYYNGTNSRTIMGFLDNTGGTLAVGFNLGATDGTFSQTVHHASSLSTTTWYHLTIGYRDSDKAYRMFLRDTSGNTVGSDVSGTATNNIGLFSGSDFMLGTYGTGATPVGNYWDGYQDEAVIFSKLLTATDATNIAKGLYSGTGDSGGTMPTVSDTATLTEDVKMHIPIYVPMMKLS